MKKKQNNKKQLDDYPYNSWKFPDFKYWMSCKPSLGKVTKRNKKEWEPLWLAYCEGFEAGMTDTYISVRDAVVSVRKSIERKERSL